MDDKEPGQPEPELTDSELEQQAGGDGTATSALCVPTEAFCAETRV